MLSTVNGRHAPLLDLPAGQVVRLRVLNLDNTLTYRLNLPGGERASMPSTAIRSRHVRWARNTGSAGMRIDLALKVPQAGTELSLRNGPLRLATLRAVAHDETAGDWPPPANPVAVPDLQRAETLRFNFSGLAICRQMSSRGGLRSGRSTARRGTSTTRAAPNGRSRR